MNMCHTKEQINDIKLTADIESQQLSQPKLKKVMILPSG